MKAMHKMGGVRVWRGEGDESKDQGEAFDKWMEVMWTNLIKLETAAKADSMDGEYVEDEYDDEDEDDDDEDDDEPLVDLEDLGSVMQKGAAADKDKPVSVRICLYYLPEDFVNIDVGKSYAFWNTKGCSFQARIQDYRYKILPHTCRNNIYFYFFRFTQWSQVVQMDKGYVERTWRV